MKKNDLFSFLARTLSNLQTLYASDGNAHGWQWAFLALLLRPPKISIGRIAMESFHMLNACPSTPVIPPPPNRLPNVDNACPAWISNALAQFPSLCHSPAARPRPKFFSQIDAILSRIQNNPNASPIATRLTKLLSLPGISRTGWIRYLGIQESVAEHSFKTALLAFMLAPIPWQDSAFIMGILHDYAELTVGDLTPAQAPNTALKHAAELAAFHALCAQMPCTNARRAQFSKAFSACLSNTPTAALLHIADKLDMALQAIAYAQNYHANLDEFVSSAEKHIKFHWETLSNHQEFRDNFLPSSNRIA